MKLKLTHTASYTVIFGQKSAGGNNSSNHNRHHVYKSQTDEAIDALDTFTVVLSSVSMLTRGLCSRWEGDCVDVS